MPTAILTTLVVTLGSAALAFWIWMLVDCLKHERSEGNDKVLWLILIIATKLIGAIVYYFVRRPERLRLEAELQ